MMNLISAVSAGLLALLTLSVPSEAKWRKRLCTLLAFSLCAATVSVAIGEWRQSPIVVSPVQFKASTGAEGTVTRVQVHNRSARPIHNIWVGIRIGEAGQDLETKLWHSDGRQFITPSQEIDVLRLDAAAWLTKQQVFLIVGALLPGQTEEFMFLLKPKSTDVAGLAANLTVDKWGEDPWEIRLNGDHAEIRLDPPPGAKTADSVGLWLENRE